MNEKIFRYDGSNQNTPDAWIGVDTPEIENAGVDVNDNFGTHTWQRKKSNDNARGEIKDGKGFSFFFARYAFLDGFKYEDGSFETNQNPDCSSFLAAIPFEQITFFDFVKNDPNLKERLDPQNSVLLIINTDASGIISAAFTNKKEAIVAYTENYKYLFRKWGDEIQPLHESQLWLVEKAGEFMNSQLTKGYDQFEDFLLSLKETNTCKTI